MTKLSRSKLELMFECQRCFWLYVGKGIGRPSSAPYTINNAIDFLLKKEFDEHRLKGTAHYLIEREGIDAVPFMHNDIDKWRHNFTGIQYEDNQHNFLIFGAVDDIWIDSQQNLIVVDYKASGSKESEVYNSYKRQMELYQWLLRKNGFSVNSRGYFVYCRVNYDSGFSNGNLCFDIKVQPYDGDDTWVDPSLDTARALLNGLPPQSAEDCSYCKYTNNSNKCIPPVQPALF